MALGKELDSIGLTLRAGSRDEQSFFVSKVRGREKLNGCYAFDVTLASDVDDKALLDEVLDRPARLVLELAGVHRVVDGTVATATAEDEVTQDGRRVFRLRIVPRLARLRHRRDSRVFQRLDVREIVDRVLEAADVPRVWKLSGSYAKREYCTQYRETDLAFVRRLLAEEGILFWFEHGEVDGKERERVVFCDDVAYYPALGEPLLHRHDVLRPLIDDVRRFALRGQLRSGSSVHRDFDYARPKVDLREDAVVPGSAADLEIYDHHGTQPVPNWDFQRERAALHLTIARRSATVAEGTSHAPALAPGLRFTLQEPSGGQLEGEYVVTEIEHEAHVAPAANEASYVNRFRCVPSKVRFVAKKKRRPSLSSCLTATVVGPAGEEIYVNGAGEIRVQFHWDRLGRNDEHSSCWLRVMQPWAGSQWGAQFLPRVGMEVIVGFVEGDLDRPVVLGTLYNGTHLMPFPLKDKTKSGFVTKTHGGQGSNALVFEDAEGKEEVLVRGHRDVTVEASANYAVTVGGGAKTSVKGDATTSVKGAQREQVGGLKLDAVSGERTELTGGAWTHRVTGNATLDAQGDLLLNAKQRMVVAALEGMTTTVGTPKKPAELGTFVHGVARLGVSDTLEVHAPNGITMVCGKSKLRLLPDKIELETDTLSLKAAKGITAASAKDGPTLQLDEEVKLSSKKITFYAEKGTIALDDKGVKLSGPSLKLDADPEKRPEPKTEEEKKETKKLTLQLTDSDFKPLADKKYHVLVAGELLEGTTDGDGMVDQTIPKSAKSAKIDLWMSDYPTGEQRHWELDLMDEFPAVDTVQGAKLRLRNLGYYTGAIDDQASGAFREALLRVQWDFGLDATGKLDKSTIDHLENLHSS